MTTTPTRLEPHQRGHASDATGADGADCTAEEVKGQRDNIVDRIAAHLNTTTLTQVPYPRKLGDTCQAVALSRACGVEVVHRCGVHDHLFVAPEHDQGSGWCCGTTGRGPTSPCMPRAMATSTSGSCCGTGTRRGDDHGPHARETECGRTPR